MSSDSFERAARGGRDRTPEQPSPAEALVRARGEPELMVLEKIAAATRWVVEEERAGEKAEIEPFDYSAAEIMGLPPQEFRVALQSLIRKGLAFDDSFGRWDARAYTFARATDLGLRFLEWLGADHL